MVAVGAVEQQSGGGSGEEWRRGQRRHTRHRRRAGRGELAESESCESKTWWPPGVRTKKISKIGLRRIRADIIEAGNEWPVHIAVVVLLAVEESRGEWNTCAGGELGWAR
jgi:hypothetical protein